MSTPAELPAQLPAEVPQKHSAGFREVARICLNVLVTFVTLIPLLYLAIAEDIPGLIGELMAQAVVVAGVIAKIMRVPMVEAWLESWGIGRDRIPAAPVASKKVSPKVSPKSIPPVVP